MKSQIANQKSQIPRGFALIELLVVIAIVAILTTVLLPALNRAKYRGQSIACVNNVKQLQLAWHMYVEDAVDALPPNNTGPEHAQPAALQGQEPRRNDLKDLRQLQAWIRQNP